MAKLLAKPWLLPKIKDKNKVFAKLLKNKLIKNNS